MRPPVHLTPTTKAIMAVMADAGYVVAIGRGPDGRIVANGQDPAGET